jgi:hypothetical protein
MIGSAPRSTSTGGAARAQKPEAAHPVNLEEAAFFIYKSI